MKIVRTGRQQQIFEFEYNNEKYRFVAETEIQMKRILALANYLNDTVMSDRDYLIKYWTEPNTIQWIQNFEKDDLLFDIGANVGMFTIFAAINRKTRVIAFEPSINESRILNYNLFINKLGDLVKILGGIALSDSEGFDTLYIQQFGDYGGNFLGESKDEYLRQVPMEFKQGCFKTTIDQLVFEHELGYPDHIKIDVDGIEHLIIEGATKTLSNRIPKSINLEVNKSLRQHFAMLEKIQGFGYSIKNSPDLNSHQIQKSDSDALINVFFYRNEIKA